MTLCVPLIAVSVVVVWRVQHSDLIDRTVEAIDRALGERGISHKQAAAACGMSKQLWSKLWKQGGNLASLMVIEAEWPGFAVALRRQLAACAAPGDQRRARLDAVTSGAPKKCDL